MVNDPRVCARYACSRIGRLPAANCGNVLPLFAGDQVVAGSNPVSPTIRKNRFTRVLRPAVTSRSTLVHASDMAAGQVGEGSTRSLILPAQNSSNRSASRSAAGWSDARAGKVRSQPSILCQDTPSSAAIAETVVRSIINRRNTYRAQRRVVDARGTANVPKSWLNTERLQSLVMQR